MRRDVHVESIERLVRWTPIGLTTLRETWIMSFAHEKQVFRSHLLELLGPENINEGKYAVIREDRVDGPFDTYELALAHGYETYALSSFMVKKLERNETALYFSRNIAV